LEVICIPIAVYVGLRTNKAFTVVYEKEEELEEVVSPYDPKESIERIE